MKREDIIEQLDYAPAKAIEDDAQVELSKNVIIEINSIFNHFESKTCKTCKYINECNIYKVAMIEKYSQFNNNFGCNKWVSNEAK
jgi:hypothetical protein